MFRISNNEITLTRGDSAEFDIELSTCDGEPYEPQEGDVIEFTVKDNVYSSQALIHKTGSRIFIEPEDTAKMSYKEYVYDVQVTLADGTVDTVIPPSKLQITSEVTF